MQGSKRLISGRGKSAVYELRVATGRDPVTGKYGQVSRRWPGYAVDDPEVTTADKALAKLVKELEGNLSGRTAGAGITVDQLLTKWLKQITSEGRSPTTLREYRRLIDKRISPAHGSMPASARAHDDHRHLPGHRLQPFIVLPGRGRGQDRHCSGRGTIKQVTAPRGETQAIAPGPELGWRDPRSTGPAEGMVGGQPLLGVNPPQAHGQVRGVSRRVSLQEDRGHASPTRQPCPRRQRSVGRLPSMPSYQADSRSRGPGGLPQGLRCPL